MLDTERLSYLQEHLTEKYRTLQSHAIVTVDDDALRFLIDLHESIFPGVPIVFCGVNNPIDEDKVAAQKVITGVMEVLDRKETIDAALALHPAAKKLAVITDTTTNGIGNRLIQKPFSIQNLAAKVRESLDESNRKNKDDLLVHQGQTLSA
jgi:hypothetical protein